MNDSDEKYVTDVVESKGIPLIGMIQFDETLREADRQSKAPIDLDEYSPAVEAIKKLKVEVLIKLKEMQHTKKD
ncbi:MAG: hypothetical protein E4H14_12730 [Candidatus Thorarchaeota archaeon]|nr:MAG: hypothetical protein E4H14_12730 [Candidatus Thorarchaeota archaeon]